MINVVDVIDLLLVLGIVAWLIAGFTDRSYKYDPKDDF